MIENATRVELFLKKGWIEKYLPMNLSLKRCCESLTVFQAFQSAILLVLNLQKQPTDVFYKKSFSWKFLNIHRETLTQVFSCEYCKILRTTIFKNICKRLFRNLATSGFFFFLDYSGYSFHFIYLENTLSITSYIHSCHKSP